MVLERTHNPPTAPPTPEHAVTVKDFKVEQLCDNRLSMFRERGTDVNQWVCMARV